MLSGIFSIERNGGSCHLRAIPLFWDLRLAIVAWFLVVGVASRCISMWKFRINKTGLLGQAPLVLVEVREMVTGHVQTNGNMVKCEAS